MGQRGEIEFTKEGNTIAERLYERYNLLCFFLQTVADGNAGGIRVSLGDELRAAFLHREFFAGRVEIDTGEFADRMRSGRKEQ